MQINVIWTLFFRDPLELQNIAFQFSECSFLLTVAGHDNKAVKLAAPLTAVLSTNRTFKHIEA